MLIIVKESLAMIAIICFFLQVLASCCGTILGLYWVAKADQKLKESLKNK